jgi:hypothetical protein
MKYQRIILELGWRCERGVGGVIPRRTSGQMFQDDVNGFSPSSNIYFIPRPPPALSTNVILNIEGRLLIFISLYFVFLFSVMQYDSVK